MAGGVGRRLAASGPRLESGDGAYQYPVIYSQGDGYLVATAVVRHRDGRRRRSLSGRLSFRHGNQSLAWRVFADLIIEQALALEAQESRSG